MMQDNSDKPLMPLFMHKGVVLAGCFPAIKAKEGGADVFLVDDFSYVMKLPAASCGVSSEITA